MIRPTLPFILALLGFASPAVSRTFLCFGDSNTAGVSGDPADSYVPHLAELLCAAGEPDLEIRNLGRAGDALAGHGSEEGAGDRLARMVADFPMHSLLIVMAGTNDVTAMSQGYTDLDDVEAALVSMLDAVAVRPDLSVVVATLLPRVDDHNGRNNILTHKLSQRIAAVAAGRFPVVRVDEAVRPYASRLTYRDQRHPTGLLFPVVARALAEAIRKQPVPDLVGPLPVQIAPKAWTTDAPSDTTIRLTLRDLGHTPDPTSAVLTVDNEVVRPIIRSLAGGRDVGLTYPLPECLRAGQVVTVRLEISDTASPPNHTSIGYSLRARPDIEGSEWPARGHDGSIASGPLGAVSVPAVADPPGGWWPQSTGDESPGPTKRRARRVPAIRPSGH